MQRSFLKRSAIAGTLGLFTLSACGGVAGEQQPWTDSQSSASQLQADGRPASVFGVRSRISVKGINREPAEQLGIKIRRLLRHYAATERDIANLLHANWIDEEREL